MKKSTTLALSLMFIFNIILISLNAQQQVKVLFVGNSFTYVEDLPGKFRGLAQAAGKQVVTDMVANGGQYFTGSGGHSTSTTTYNKIKSQAWDYVVLQDNQGYFAGYVDGMSSSTIAANIRVRDSVRASNPCARVIWFAGWGLLGGYPSGIPGDNTIKMNDRIDTNYQILNSKYSPNNKQEFIAPFGRTWNAAIKAQPSIESLLFNTDGNHPGKTGQLANAAVLYTMIFKQDPSNVNYVPSGVSAANASLVRKKAYETVMTGYMYVSHNMPENTPVITQNGATLSAPSGYSGYQWYLNNSPIAGATAQNFTPSIAGTYMVIANSSNGCAQNWSFPITVTATGIEEVAYNTQIKVYPNPLVDRSVIYMDDINWQNASIEVSNISGQVVRSAKADSHQFIIERDGLPSGLYLISIQEENGLKHTGKIMVQ